MVIFAQAITGFFVEAIVARQIALTVGPQQCQQVDATHHCLILARPVMRHQGHFLGIRLVQRRVVEHQHPLGFVDLGLAFLPQCRRIWFQSQQQPREEIMRRCIATRRLHPTRFQATVAGLGRYDKIDVILFIAFRSVHTLSLQHLSTA